MGTQDADSQHPEPQEGYPMDVGRFDWEALIDRAELPKHLKTVAYVMAHKANGDGSHVRPGIALVADILNDSEKTTGDYINQLVDLGWLRLVRKGGGTKREGKASIFQLTTPGPSFPMRLAPKTNERLIERPKGKRPARRSDLKPASPQPLAAVAADLNPASADLHVDNSTDLNSASPQSPVDNFTDLKPTSVGSLVDEPTDPNHASGDQSDRPEVERRPTRSGLPTDLKPASDYQSFDHPSTTTTRVSELGDHSHLPRGAVIHKASHLDLGHGTSEPPETHGADSALPAPAATPTVTDAQYAEAYEALSVLPDLGQFLIARAAQQYAEQGWSNLPTRVLAVRAAQLATPASDERRSA